MIRSGLAALFLGIVAALIILGPSLDSDDLSLPEIGAGPGSSHDGAGSADGAPIEAETPPAGPEAASPDASVAVSADALGEAPPVIGPAPELIEIDGWLNTDQASFDAFDGQVRIVQFWTFGCHNCKATIPYLQSIYADAGPRGLEIIGVHAPEFDYEADPMAVATAAQDLGVTWPIALDTDKTNFGIWQGNRRFWPRTYVLDQDGQIRFDHVGEGDYEELAATVDWLLEHGP